MLFTTSVRLWRSMACCNSWRMLCRQSRIVRRSCSERWDRFAHLVREKGVVADVAPQLRTAQQIGVEEKRPAFGLEFHAPIVEPDALPRGEEDERPLLIVVGATAVLDIAALDIFEKYRVEPHAEPDALAERTLRKVDDADERMQRLAAQRVVVVEDVVYSYDVVHHSVRI